MRHRWVGIAVASLIAGIGLIAAPARAQTPQGLEKLSHILVVYLENRSFDNLFGEFPGANGIANAGAAATQRKLDNVVYDPWLPRINFPFKSEQNPDDVA